MTTAQLLLVTCLATLGISAIFYPIVRYYLKKATSIEEITKLLQELNRKFETYSTNEDAKEDLIKEKEFAVLVAETALNVFESKSTQNSDEQIESSSTKTSSSKIVRNPKSFLKNLLGAPHIDKVVVPETPVDASEIEK